MQDLIFSNYRDLLDNMTQVVPPPPPERVTATEMQHKLDAANRRLAMKNQGLVPEVWSSKLLKYYANNIGLGGVIKPVLVGPDWPEYQGIQKQKEEAVIEFASNLLARRIESDVHDAMVYGVGVTRLKNDIGS
jgi:hypothetical protein